MKKALLLIDMQKGFLGSQWPERNNPQAEEKMLTVLEHFRESGQEVIHICHKSRLAEDSFYKESDRAFMEGFEPLDGEVVFEKMVNSAFIGTDLESYLQKQGISDLVILGLTLPHCVSTTTRMAANLGFAVVLLSDATASFALPDLWGQTIDPELLHQINLASLDGEFAQVMTVEQYLNS